MDIDATFLPVAVELIDQVFPTSVVYRRKNGVNYDPSTGEVVPDQTEYSVKAGVLSRSRTEDGGVGEVYSLGLWIHHSSTGMPHLPKTDDEVDYDGTTWKVTDVDPTYSSKGLIASKLLVRSS